MNKVVFWDFDGTLAYCPELFISSMKKILDKYEKEYQICDDSLAECLQTGFPWQEPENDYQSFRNPEAWWDKTSKIFEKAYIAGGIAPEKACNYAKEVRKYLTAPGVYKLYDDTIETLKYFKESGYRNIILSNHIPELPEIATELGLMDYVDICITSALVGFEKPNPKIFLHALELAEHPEDPWMVGDNIIADVRGAEALGIKAILVRKQTAEPVRYFSPDLRGTINIISTGR